VDSVALVPGDPGRRPPEPAKLPRRGAEIAILMNDVNGGGIVDGAGPDWLEIAGGGHGFRGRGLASCSLLSPSSSCVALRASRSLNGTVTRRLDQFIPRTPNALTFLITGGLTATFCAGLRAGRVVPNAPCESVRRRAT